jgi:4-aminobutyrate aminotransferase
MAISQKEMLKLSKQHEIKCMGSEPFSIVWGKGLKVKDAEGKQYLDAISAEWVLNLGYGQPEIIEAAKKQLDQVEFVTPVLGSVPRVLLAKKLADIAPGRLKKILFAVTGGGACEGAMHLAMRKTGGQEFICFYNAFHGRTFGTIPLSYTEPTMYEECKQGLERYLAKQTRIPNFYCYRCHYGLTYPECDLFCCRFVETTIKHASDSKVAGVFVEPVQANGGQIPAPKGYLPLLQKICNENNVAMIVDEVQTAFCRCGEFWASEIEKISPDLLVLGKSFGAGLPLAGTLATEEYSHLRQWEYGFTENGHPVACAASLAMIEIMRRERLWENSKRMGQFMSKRLNEIAENTKTIGDVRGPGLMIGVEFVKNKRTKKPAFQETAYVMEKAHELGVIFGRSGPAYGSFGNVLKMKPAVTLKEEEATKIIDVFEESVKLAEKKYA